MMLPQPKTEKTVDTSSEEERICAILSDIEGAGDVSIVITYYTDDKGKSGNAKGAVVTADGAWDTGVRNNLAEAVQAVLDLPAHRVKVFKSKHQQ